MAYHDKGLHSSLTCLFVNWIFGQRIFLSAPLFSNMSFELDLLSACLFYQCRSSPTRLLNHFAHSPSSIMARTKNTAKKCTGGSAPSVLLKISRVQLSGGDHQKMKALSATRGALPVGGGDLEKRNSQHEALTTTRAATSEDLEIRSAHNEYCILCRDGAEHYEDNTLFMCALCPRVVCKLCLQLPPDIETKVLQEDVSFRCICCHLKMEQSAAYFGFYKSNSLPFLDKFLSVTGALEVSARAEISAAPVIFIHLILVDFGVAGSPFEFAHSFLKPYYSGDGIKYIEVYYNIGTDVKLAPYRTHIRQIIKGLKNSFTWERVVIGLSTHTDEDFGDPFAGYGDDSKGYVSTPVNDFLDIILQPWQSIIDHAQESYLWMLCCGSLVNNLDSFHGLQEAVVW
ncbi:hypothetical protein C8R48DRAFT_782389 [Suillus tomentosus]|nr:hypothetical protein C8R48DRAFT_782389 [Suillus tomentosus]